MNKLIKPKNIDNILSRGIVLHSRKQYADLFSPPGLNNCCAVRDKSVITQPVARALFDCRDVVCCRSCFLKANNYLNILKYIKKRRNNATSMVKI